MRHILWFLASLLLAANLALISTEIATAQEEGFKPLKNVVVVLDSGHGELGGKHMWSDPGCGEPTDRGLCAWEATFSWDTTMRTKQRFEELGATVVMTTHDPDGDYRPKSWGPYSFPTVSTEQHKRCKKLASGQFTYKELFHNPNPRDDGEALDARVDVANEVYNKHRGSKEVFFISLHFDAIDKFTHPISGMAIHVKPGGGTAFSDYFLDEVRTARRVRMNLLKGIEEKSREYSAYRILRRSENPDAYLIELGHIRSRDPKTGKNPDLFRMRNPRTRQEYAELIARALTRHVLKRPLGPSTPVVLTPSTTSTPKVAPKPPVVKPAPKPKPLSAAALKRWRTEQFRQAKVMRAQVVKPGALKGLVVYIDSAHGIGEGGVVWRGIQQVLESLYVWDVSVRLSKYLRLMGAQVRLTVRNPLDPNGRKAEYWHPTEHPKPLVNLALIAKPSPSARTDREKRTSARALAVRQSLKPGEAQRAIFLSLHAEPAEAASGATVWRWKDSSRGFRATLAKALGRLLHVRVASAPDISVPVTVDAGVLDPRFNPLSQRLVVNLANPAYASDRKLLTTWQGREMLARQLAVGILSYWKGVSKR